jgi:hypothetical protein
MQIERRLGHKPNGGPSARPCDIDDIALVFLRLHKRNALHTRHVAAMHTYGMAQRPPDRRVDPRGLQAWTEAMDILYTPLAKKGIVELRHTIVVVQPGYEFLSTPVSQSERVAAYENAKFRLRRGMDDDRR